MRFDEGCLAERMGPVRFGFRLCRIDKDLHWVAEAARLLGVLPLPTRWLDGVRCRAYAERERDQFEVDAREVFGGGNGVEHDRSMVRDALEERAHQGVVAMHEEGVIPRIDHGFVDEGLEGGEVEHHSLVAASGLWDRLTDERHLECIAMAVQVATPAFMVGNAVPGVEFEASGDLHGRILAEKTAAACRVQGRGGRRDPVDRGRARRLSLPQFPPLRRGRTPFPGFSARRALLS